MEDPFLAQLYSWFSSFDTTLEQKQQKLVASSPKNNMGQSLSTKCTFARLTRQSKKTLKDMLDLGIKERL
jgi:hypothetical protein